MSKPVLAVATACPCGRRRPGVARRASNFLLRRQKKVTKEKATPSLRPLRFAPGQTCVVSVAGCAVELTALRCSFVLTATASQSTKHARSDARATPQPPRRRRSQQGWDSRTSKQPDIHSGHCFARPGLAGASATRCANWAERSKGPCGCFAPFAPLDAPRSAAGGVACVPKDTHASLSSSPQLFERSAPARSEFCGAPRSRAPQVAPARSAGVADSGVAFSLVTFFWRRKRKLLARRATPGLRPQPEHAFPTSTPRLRQAQPERMGRRTGFDGLSMNGLKD